MAHHKSALKRIRSSEKARLVNRRYRNRMRELTKSVLTEQNKTEATKKLNEIVSFLDKLVLRNIIHLNKAANQKSRLMQFVNKLP